jgi:hypothetical protein
MPGIKSGRIFFSVAEFYGHSVTLAVLSLKELVTTLLGGQINAGKFSYWPILKSKADKWFGMLC